jgi:hypothetical protein
VVGAFGGGGSSSSSEEADAATASAEAMNADTIDIQRENEEWLLRLHDEQAYLDAKNDAYDPEAGFYVDEDGNPISQYEVSTKHEASSSESGGDERIPADVDIDPLPGSSESGFGTGMDPT